MTINIVNPFWQNVVGWGCIGTVVVLTLILIFKGYGTVWWTFTKAGITLWLVLGIVNIIMIATGETYIPFSQWLWMGFLFCQFLAYLAFIFVGYIVMGGEKIVDSMNYQEWKQEELERLEAEHSTLRGTYQLPHRKAAYVVEENPNQLPPNVPVRGPRLRKPKRTAHSYEDKDGTYVEFGNGVRSYKNNRGWWTVTKNGSVLYSGRDETKAEQATQEGLGDYL